MDGAGPAGSLLAWGLGSPALGQLEGRGLEPEPDREGVACAGAGSAYGS